MTATLYYVHDPMCSWCWGFRPTWNALKQALPDTVTVENVSGGLARDCDELMPEEMQRAIEGYWRTIETQLGTEFNFDFWRLNQPRRSTYMSCRAAIAAGFQDSEEAMIYAIQRGYFLRALNPSDVPVLVKLAGELGLDQDRFEGDLLSASTELELQRQLKLARKLPIHGFPSLVLAVGEKTSRIDIDYLEVDGMLEAINQCLEVECR
jgi:putative protein-disulfide isomerase